MTLAFSLSGIAKRYPHFALQDITLDLPEGQVMGLVGVNGAGKTTLLRLLTGLASADAGEVTVLGHRLPEAQVAAKRDIGFASEDMRLYRSQSLRWHMDLIRRIYPGWDETYAAELLKRFDLDRNGSLDLKEWELARTQARREIAATHRELRTTADVHVMHRPEDGRLYLISDLAPNRLATTYRRWSWFHLAVFFLGLGALPVLWGMPR